MNRKGFTLVELLAVIFILAVLSLLATPAYIYIRDSVNQTMYENKVKLLLAAAESWAGETGYDSVNIGHLIEEGRIEADNEFGDFKNPVNGDSMLCKVIRIEYENNQYVAKYTEEEVCDYNELVTQSSIITISQYKEDGTRLKDGEWTNGTILLKVELKEGHTGKVGNIKHLEIRGNNQNVSVDLNNNFNSQNTITVQAAQILKTEFEAKVTVLENGITKDYRAKTEVRIDKQRPLVYTDEVSINNENNWTSKGKKVTFTMSDGNGSGIFGYAVTTNPDCTKATYTQTDKKKITREFGSGTHYICVKDRAGNLSEDVSKQKFVISKIDNNPPKIDKNTGFQILSNGNGFNDTSVTLKITATDETSLSMCISNTGYEKDCVWEPYVPTKNWNISSTLDGKTHYVYLTLRDQAGNKVHVTSKGYDVYSECSKSTKRYTSEWGSCSAECGGGIQYRSYEVKDNYTGKVCSRGSDQQACNTQSCVMDFDHYLYIHSNNLETSREFYLGEVGTYKIKIQGEMIPWCYWRELSNGDEVYKCLTTTFRMRYTANAEKGECSKWTSKTIITKSVEGWYPFDTEFTVKAEVICFQYGSGGASSTAFNSEKDSGVDWGFTYERID